MFKLNVKSLSILSFIIVVIIAFVFYFINISKNNSNSNISVNFNSTDIITIDSKLAISDVLGKSLTNDTTEDGVFGFLDFSVTSNSNKKVKYEINLVKQNVIGPTIKENYIKLYLTDFNNNDYSGFSKNSLIPNYSQLSNSRHSNSKVLFVDEINPKEKKNYRLRVWLSDSYVVASNSESFSFDVDVNVI